MPSHSSTNFEIKKYDENEVRFNWLYSRDNLQKIKNVAYVINFNECCDIGTHQVASYVQKNDATYFDFFRVKHIPKRLEHLSVIKS